MCSKLITFSCEGMDGWCKTLEQIKRILSNVLLLLKLSLMDVLHFSCGKGSKGNGNVCFKFDLVLDVK